MTLRQCMTLTTAAVLQREQQQSDTGTVTDKVRRYQVTVAPAVRARLEAQQEALNRTEPLPEAEIAAARALLIQHLQPRESIMQGLARLSAALAARVHVRVWVRSPGCACSSHAREAVRAEGEGPGGHEPCVTGRARGGRAGGLAHRRGNVAAE
jgi:hypothetical protein